MAAKLARSLQINRANQGGTAKRDINAISQPDSQIPPVLEDNDENVAELMKRLQRMMPANTQPAFKNGEELMARAEGTG